MQAAMDRLDGFTRRHGRLVAVAWLALLIAAIPFAARQTDHLTSGGFEVPGSGSATVERGLADFDNAQPAQRAVVLAKRPGSDEGSVRAAIATVRSATGKVDNVKLSQAAAQAAEKQSGDSPITVLPLELAGTQNDAADAASDLRKELGIATHPASVEHVELHLVGQQALWAGMQDLSKHDLESAEKAGFPIVLLILLAVFGSLAAAALPLALGFVSVAITGAAIFFLSQATEMSVFLTNVASMIGIGVVVDYSLFILARYREEIGAGASREEARRTAMRTSGIAVAFSGVTVMIALAGLFLIDAATIRSMAMGAIVVVAVSVLAATTLLPVLMSMFGRRAYSRGRVAILGGLVSPGLPNWRPRAGSTRPSRERAPFWERWAAGVMRHPLIAAGLSAAVLLTLAVPALSLTFGDGALRQFPAGNETRVGAELAAKATGPGASGPAQVLVTAEQGKVDRQALERYVAELKRDPEAASVARPQLSRFQQAALIAVTPRHDPESPAARALVSRLRAGDHAVQGAHIEVGGSTAQVEDFKDLVSGSM